MIDICRHILGLTLLVVPALFPPVCLAGDISAGTDDVVELRLWNIPPKGSATPLDVARRRVFDVFTMEHPEIRIKALVPLKIEGPAQESNEFLAVAGGVAPDVFSLFGRKIGDYNSQGFLYPLNDYLAEYTGRTGKPYSGIAAPSHVWELCYDRDKIIAVPLGYYSMALMIDNAAFAKAGLAGRVPKDWDELYTFARHLTIDPTKEPDADPNAPVQYGMNILTGIYAGWHYLQYVWSAGGEVVQPYYPMAGNLVKVPVPPVDYRKYDIQLSNEKQYYASLAEMRGELQKQGLPVDYSISDLEWRLETNSSDAIQALYFYRRLAHQPWIRNGDHEFDITPEMFKTRKAVDPVTGDVFNLDDPLVQKRIYYGVSTAAEEQAGTTQLRNITYAMQIGGLSEANINDPNLSTFVPFPSRKGYPPAAFMAGHYIGINAAIRAENIPGRRDLKAIQDAAWKFIEFQTSPSAQKIMIKTFAEYGLAEFIRPALLEDAGYGDLLARIPPVRRQLWDNLTTYAHIEPYSIGFTHVMTRELGMAIEAILSDPCDTRTGSYSRDPQAVMDEICRNVNTMILGKMPEKEVRRRSFIGWIIFSIMILGLLLGANQIIQMALRSQVRAGSEGFGVGGNIARSRIYAWMFLIPAVLSIAIWAYYPLMRGLLMAFQDYRILGGSTYVGLRNFVEAVSEPKFWRYLLQTLQYVTMLLGIGFFAPIILAILLTEIPRGKILYRTIYYLPAVTTGLVTLFLWKGLLYDPSNTGVINRLILFLNTWPPWLAVIAKAVVWAGIFAIVLSLLSHAAKPTNSTKERWVTGVFGCAGLCLIIAFFVNLFLRGGNEAVSSFFLTQFDFKVQRFLRDPDLAMFWLVIPVIWAGAGPGCLIYLAALKSIPEEQYEAADLDGAGVWQKIVNVIYPNLKALIIINFVGAVIGGFKEASNIFVMTGGGPEDATMTTGLYIWFNAFMFLNFGLATAMAWIMGALLIGFTLTQLRILNKVQFRTAGVEGEPAGGRP